VGRGLRKGGMFNMKMGRGVRNGGRGARKGAGSKEGWKGIEKGWGAKCCEQRSGLHITTSS